MAKWKRDKEKRRAYLLKYNYGISVKEYDLMFEKQGGCCAICGKPSIERALSTDHDHETGKVRGLLCRNCNLALGHFKDDVSLMKRAIEYLG